MNYSTEKGDSLPDFFKKIPWKLISVYSLIYFPNSDKNYFPIK